VTYETGDSIKKILYKIGLQALVKHVECFILYTESDEDLEKFIYIPTKTFYDFRKSIHNDILSLTEYKELFRCIMTINIFEFTSLLEFQYIYQDFKDLINYNWNELDMNSLIEI
jgi:hypothetical protein